MKHWKYLRYVLRHKYYVFLECWKLGIPVTGLLHDLSKFRPSEWIPYADYFYGQWGVLRPDCYLDYPSPHCKVNLCKNRFDIAWQHHQNRNPHHWEYWVKANNENLYENRCLEMPDKDRKEMLADWRAMSRTQGGTTKSWYLRQRQCRKIHLHPRTTNWIEGEIAERPVA